MTTATFTIGSAAPFNEKASLASDQDLCFVCGRKLGNNPLHFEVVDGGSLRGQDGTEADVDDAGYMGCYPVGASCANKFEAGILFKMKK